MMMGQAQMGSLSDAPQQTSDSTERQQKLSRASQTCATLAALFEESLSAFWQVPAKLRFFSVSPKTQYFWRLEDFFASQVELGNGAAVQLRLSKNMCEVLLSNTLGNEAQNHQTGFSLKKLTRFEQYLLTESTKDILSHVAVQLMRHKDSVENSDELLHMIWLISLDSEENNTEQDIGKLVLSIPLSLLDALNELGSEASQPETPGLSDELFFHAHSSAQLYVGNTQLRLDDIKNMETDDIVVLDNSQSNRLYLMAGEDEHIPFTANLLNIETIEVNTTMDETTATAPQPAGKTLWDNLLIDVHAEFDPTQMPLNELKQMSEGLIVEVADLDKSSLRLHVEGKTVATGELVIVGDKLGVRIKQVVPEDGAQAIATEAQTPMPQGDVAQAGEEAPQQQVQEQTPEAPQQNTEDVFAEDSDDALFEDEWDI